MSRYPGQLCRDGPADGGFSLVEVVIAVVVFAIAAAGTATTLIASIDVSAKNQQRVAAADLGVRALEGARDAVKNSVAIPGTSTSAVVVGGITYQVSSTASWVSVGETGSSCTGAVPGTVAYRRVSVSVTWPNMHGAPPITADTIVTPLNPNTITVPVQVVGASRTPLVGQTVTLAPAGGGTSQSASTDSNGCVVFAQLAPGKYTVTVNTPGYVDSTSVAAQNHTETVGQSIPGVTPVDVISYDQPGSLAVSLQYTAADPLPTSGLSYTVQQTGWSDGSSKALAGTAFPLPVFPFAAVPGSGYSVYAGTCTDSAPATIPGTALGTPAAGTTATVSVPLASVIGTFQKPLLNVLGIQIGVTPVGSGYAVKLADPTAGCTESLPLTGTTSSSSTLAFSVPYGSYTVTLTKAGKPTLNASAVSITAASSSLTVLAS